MDIATIIGVLAGIAVVIGSIVSGGNSKAFINMPSLLVTLGGTLAATFIYFPMDRLLRLPRVLVQIWRTETANTRDLIESIVALDGQARREGLLALDAELENIPEPLLRRGVMMVVDGETGDSIRRRLGDEIDRLAQEIEQDCHVFDIMANLSPAFGMVGTLIGLVTMLSDLDDPESVAPALAVALITTLYGVLMANLVFTPISGKLGIRGQQKIQVMEIIMEGVIGIQTGENPRTLRDRLLGMAGYREAVNETDESTGSEEFVSTTEPA